MENIFKEKYNELPKIEYCIISLLFNKCNYNLQYLLHFIKNKEVLNVIFKRTLLKNIMYDKNIEM